MTSAAAASIHDYIRAKDGNRPHLIPRAFVERATLSIVCETDDIAFPPRVDGRDAIADVLVRQFARRYENVYTFCLSAPPAAAVDAFSCPWLVLMSEKDGGRVRAGTGRYDWRFDAAGRASGLYILIEVMAPLDPHRVDPVMNWAAALPYPWCPAGAAYRGAPAGVGVDRTISRLAALAAGA